MLRLIDCGIGQNKLTLYSWASSTLDTRIMVIVGRVVIGRLNWAIALLLSRSAIAREASSIPQRNIVRSSASLLSPRHDVVPGINIDGCRFRYCCRWYERLEERLYCKSGIYRVSSLTGRASVHWL